MWSPGKSRRWRSSWNASWRQHVRHAELLVPEELSWRSVTTTGGAINTVHGVDSYRSVQFFRGSTGARQLRRSARSSPRSGPSQNLISSMGFKKHFTILGRWGLAKGSWGSGGVRERGRSEDGGPGDVDFRPSSLKRRLPLPPSLEPPLKEGGEGAGVASWGPWTLSPAPLPPLPWTPLLPMAQHFALFPSPAAIFIHSSLSLRGFLVELWGRRIPHKMHVWASMGPFCEPDSSGSPFGPEPSGTTFPCSPPPPFKRHESAPPPTHKLWASSLLVPCATCPTAQCHVDFQLGSHRSKGGPVPRPPCACHRRRGHPDSSFKSALHLARAPASRQTRANMRSVRVAHFRTRPDLFHAARCGPCGSKGSWHPLQMASVIGSGKVSFSKSNARNKCGGAVHSTVVGACANTIQAPRLCSQVRLASGWTASASSSSPKRGVKEGRSPTPPLARLANLSPHTSKHRSSPNFEASPWGPPPSPEQGPSQEPRRHHEGRRTKSKVEGGSAPPPLQSAPPLSP